MTGKIQRAFGTWPSPLTAERLTASTVRLGNLQFHRGRLYWTEGRPEESGRSAIASIDTNGELETLISEPWNARTRVHEYGGLSFNISDQGILFSHFADQRLYLQSPGAEASPKAITKDNGDRFGAPTADPLRQGWIAVRESIEEGMDEPDNELARIHINGSVSSIVSGADFYADPVVSPDGNELAWVEWDHPYMPWDSARLMVGDLDENGDVVSARVVAGGPGESPFQPQWSSNGELYFMSDPNGWWNLMKWDGVSTETVWAAEVEMGLPLWVLGMSTFALVNASVAAVAFCKQGEWGLATVDLESGEVTHHDLPFTDIHQVRAEEDRIAVIGGSPVMPSAIVLLDGQTGTWDIVRNSSANAVDEAYVSRGQSIAFPTTDNATAYGFFYPPENKEYEGLEGEKPPLIVMTHGGPTAATNSSLEGKVQFWTTRGYAVLDVNYRGSTGYGRPYREALLGTWGEYDVADCVAGAQYVASKGWADSSRMAIRGGSAGGYTTLAALTFTDTFHVGASYFGVSDIEALDAETHKFESRYTQRLIAPLPEGRDIFHARSPIHHTNQLNCPVIFLQGLDDKVVPPNQSEAMVDVLKEKNIPVSYVSFEGEGHGFRQGKNIQRATLSELAFYSDVFGLEPADTLPNLTIHK